MPSRLPAWVVISPQEIFFPLIDGGGSSPYMMRDAF
jgi:hypothetical protein